MSEDLTNIKYKGKRLKRIAFRDYVTQDEWEYLVDSEVVVYIVNDSPPTWAICKRDMGEDDYDDEDCEVLDPLVLMETSDKQEMMGMVRLMAAPKEEEDE